VKGREAETFGLRWQSAATTPLSVRHGNGKRRGASLPAAVQKLFASSPNTCLLSWVKGKMTHEPEISFGNRSIPS
jgi:hypothetical protein